MMNYSVMALIFRLLICNFVCVQEGVGDQTSGESGTLLCHVICSFTWCFISHCICQKRPHLVLLRSVLLYILVQEGW